MAFCAWSIQLLKLSLMFLRYSMAVCWRERDLNLISVGRVIFLMRVSTSGSVSMRVLVRWKWYLRMQ